MWLEWRVFRTVNMDEIIQDSKGEIISNIVHLVTEDS